MISIVLAVYNGERFLNECLDSLRNQTLRDMQFILIDDGSTDSSGQICEEYAANDSRFLVVHTENKGLCKARETGIGIAAEQGAEYIGFIDSDDWLEPDMYRMLLAAAKADDADVTECGFYREYAGKRETWLPDVSNANCAGEALYDLLKGAPHDFVWNKLWKTKLLAGFRLPVDGAYADDIAFAWRIYCRVRSVNGVRKPLYHYRQVKSSIAHAHNMNLVNKWRVVLDRYYGLQGEPKALLTDVQWEQVRKNQLRYCVFTAEKNWLYWLEYPKDQREMCHEDLLEMSRFVRENAPVFGVKDWEFPLRACAFLMRHPNTVSLLLARMVNALPSGRRKVLY
ncbi:MAG: glycosyltransferase [Clostridia bacterium]|nr:glycosyltransferase [Clostridia bacterium]